MGNEIKDVIRGLRGRESLREASERIGISHTYLDTIEKGIDKRSGKPIKPTPETLKLISKAYNYSYNKLMVLAGYMEDLEDEYIQSERESIINKIENKFPDIDKMFKDLESLNANDLKEVYEFIKFKARDK